MTGSAAVRPDAVAKALGTARYSADIAYKDMLYAKALWPAQVPCLVKAIDASQAQSLPGVVKVILAADIQGANISGLYEPYDRPVLIAPGREAKFMMDALALVVAEREDIAAAALKLIEVDYAPLPGVYTVSDAVAAGNEPYIVFERENGDADGALAQADLVLEGSYEMPWLEHAYMEPEAGYSFMDDHGVIQVCFGSQNHARHHRAICKSLGLSYHRVRLTTPFVGGGFGGKHELTIQIYLALIGQLVRRPCKMTWTREESFRGGKRHCCSATARFGFRRDGRLLAIQMDAKVGAGPYMAQTPQTLKPIVSAVTGPYDVANVRARGAAYQLNCMEAVAFRGFGWPEGTMILETMMSRAAAKLGVDELEMRRINMLPEEKWFANFPFFKATLHSRHTQMDTIAKVLADAGPKPVIPGKLVGRGLSSATCTFEFGNTPGYKGTGADILMYSDGSVTLRIGFPEIGQGITGVAVRLVSDFFSIPGERVSIIQADTAVTPKAGSLGASRGTVNIGNALLDACNKLKQKLEKYAADMLDTEQPPCFANGGFYQNQRQAATLRQVMDYCYTQGKDLCAHGWYEGDSKEELKGFTFISALADVAVDEKSGDIEVLQLIACHDAGKVIYPDGARGQMYGGSVMSLGGVLYEEFLAEKGRPATPSLAEYIIPTAKDLPRRIRPSFIEVPGRYGPTGAKGMGEHMLHTAPCLVNAIYDATGLLITDLPITPEKVLRGWGKI